MTTHTVRSLPDLLDYIVDNRGRTCPVTDIGMPLIATNCLKEGKREPVFENVRYVDDDTYSNWFRAHPEPGDVLFVCKGSPGRVAVVPDPVPFCIAQDMLALRANPAVVHPGYLYYRLRAPDVRMSIGNMHVGTLIPHFKKGDFGRLRFAVHDDLSEQRAIAEILGTFDDKIAANDRLGRTTDELLATLFARLCIDASWGTLKTIATINAAVTRQTVNGSLRYVDISSVSVGNYELPPVISWDEAPGRARRVLKAGDTVWSTVRPNRRSHALILDGDANLIASTGLAVISPNKGRIACVYESTRTDEFVRYLESVAEGSAYPAVRGDRFNNAPVPDLSNDKWDRFEAMSLPLRKRAHAADRETRSLATTRDELLPLLMSGMVRVRDAEKAVGKVF